MSNLTALRPHYNDPIAVLDSDSNARFSDPMNLFVDGLISHIDVNQAAIASGLGDGDKGDISVSSGGAVWTIDTNAVTLPKMAQIATQSFLGRENDATGNVEVLSVATVLTMLNVAAGANANTTKHKEINAAHDSYVLLTVVGTTITLTTAYIAGLCEVYVNGQAYSGFTETTATTLTTATDLSAFEIMVFYESV